MVPAQEETDSVYDFLYVDIPRVQLFNSQFSQYGHITEITRSASTTSTSGGGFDLKVVKAQTEEDARTEVAKKYDAQFVGPLVFLDNVKEMLVRDLSKAGIGQFVLTSGSVSIVDLMMLKEAWNLKEVKQLANIGARSAQTGQSRQERRLADKASNLGPSQTIDFMFGLLKLMPHGMQAQISAPPHNIWSALNATGFITPPSDLSLNHGSHLPGIWNVVGILDALPGEGKAGPSDAEHSLVGNLTTTIQPLVRQMLGRPVGSFGVTPLLIFREVRR